MITTPTTQRFTATVTSKNGSAGGRYAPPRSVTLIVEGFNPRSEETEPMLTVLHEAIDYLLPAGYHAGAVRKVLEVPNG